MGQQHYVTLDLIRSCASALQYPARLIEEMRRSALHAAFPALLFTLELRLNFFLFVGSCPAARFLQIRRVEIGMKKMNAQAL